MIRQQIEIGQWELRSFLCEWIRDVPQRIDNFLTHQQSYFEHTTIPRVWSDQRIWRTTRAGKVPPAWYRITVSRLLSKIGKWSGGSPPSKKVQSRASNSRSLGESTFCRPLHLGVFTAPRLCPHLKRCHYILCIAIRWIISIDNKIPRLFLIKLVKWRLQEGRDQEVVLAFFSNWAQVILLGVMP